MHTTSTQQSTMKRRCSGRAPQGESGGHEAARVVFEPVDIVPPGDFEPIDAGRVLQMLSRIRDLSAGASLVARMLERDEVNKELGDHPHLLRPADRGTLIRMMSAVTQTVAAEAEAFMEWVDMER